MEMTQKAIAFIEKAIEKLGDESQAEFFTKTVASLKVAAEKANNDEKETRVKDAAVKYANQIAFIEFRHNALTDELAEEFRTLQTPEETNAEVKALEEARQARIDEINGMQQVVINEQKELDIFLAIIAGMSQEEAEQKMAEYEAQVAQATQR